MSQPPDFPGFDLPPAAEPAGRAPLDHPYPEPYRVYAERYSKSERSIKLYVAKGKEQSPPDLPPLDRPTEMPLWWSRVMSSRQSCPSAIMSAAQAAASPGAEPSVPVAPSVSNSPPAVLQAPEPAPSLKRPESIAVTTLEQDINHLREDLARAREDMLKAQVAEPFDAATFEMRQKKWRALRQEVETAEEALWKLRSKQGRLVDVDEHAAKLLPRLQTIAQGIRSLCRRLRPQLAAAATEADQDQIWDQGIESLFTHLVEDGFVTRSPLELR